MPTISCQQPALLLQRFTPQSKTISKKFLLIYPDGSKKHIARAERDTLVLSNQAKLCASGNYLFTGQVRTFHSFAELSHLEITPQHLRHFLPGFFIFECKQRRVREFLESPEHLAWRMQCPSPI